MVRSLVVLGALGLALVAAAPAAQAKGEGFVTISGPAGFSTITLTNPAEVASLFWGGGLGEPERMDAPDHPNTQGARYVIKFVLWDQGERPRTYRQFLYPFADQGRQGMWSFTPPGQRWGGRWRVPSGWWVVSVDAEGILGAHGIPAGAPSPRPSAGHMLWA